MWFQVRKDHDLAAEEDLREEVRRQVGMLIRAWYNHLMSSSDSHESIRAIPARLKRVPLELDRFHADLEHEPQDKRHFLRDLDLTARRLVEEAAELECPSPDSFKQAVDQYLEFWRT